MSRVSTKLYVQSLYEHLHLTLWGALTKWDSLVRLQVYGDITQYLPVFQTEAVIFHSHG